MELAEALAKIDHWATGTRVLKVVVISEAGDLADSGWGGAETDGTAFLRLVYGRDADQSEVETVHNVSGASVSNTSIWDASPSHQEMFGQFDEVVGLSLTNGQTILLMCMLPKEQRDN